MDTPWHGGFLIRSYLVNCPLCGDWTEDTAKTMRIMERKLRTQHFWYKHRDYGWICKTCAATHKTTRRR